MIIVIFIFSNIAPTPICRKCRGMGILNKFMGNLSYYSRARVLLLIVTLLIQNDMPKAIYIVNTKY